jgi:hypothetical protein
MLSITSVTRMITWSRIPPLNPAMSPREVAAQDVGGARRGSDRRVVRLRRIERQKQRQQDRRAHDRDDDDAAGEREPVL